MAWSAGVLGASTNAIMFCIIVSGVRGGHYIGWEPWALGAWVACAAWASYRYAVISLRKAAPFVAWNVFEAAVLANVAEEQRAATRYALHLAVGQRPRGDAA
jgi:hypothetical protein